jgi:integrase
MAELGGRQAIAARALAFTVLTAARTGEVIAATWDEFNFEEKVWTLPAGRMKGGKEHKVPLADPVLKMLQALPREADNPFVFIGQQSGGGLSNMAMLTLLKRMGRAVTAHGFRSSFRDWAAERTSYQNFIVEMCLAHVVGGVEGTYRRGDLLEKRRRLMSEWAKFCASTPATGENVVALKEAVR